jgi:RimJ/RimL family protein N-acetyltransferase
MARRKETRLVRLDLAAPQDAPQLTVIQGRAFHDDVRFIPPDVLERLHEADDPGQGPPGVTDIEWTRRMIQSPKSVYYKILLGDRMVGGVILAADAEAYPEENFWRIFIEPVYHGRGIGQEAFRQVFRLHPDVKRWRLGTPEYATRNRHFYESMGFVLLEIHDLDDAWFRGCEYENALPQEERLKL